MRPLNKLALTAAFLFALPAWSAVTTLRDVTRELHKYNADERKLAGAGEQAQTELITHWKQLGVIHAALVKLEARGTLKRARGAERLTLHHELAELLGSAADVSAVSGRKLAEHFVEADELRKGVLAEIAAIADRNLDFDVREVLGVKVDTGGS
jgi:hypothetical protein